MITRRLFKTGSKPSIPAPWQMALLGGAVTGALIALGVWWGL